MNENEHGENEHGENEHGENDVGDHPERDRRVGDALRSLTVGESRDGFWKDVESDLRHADLGAHAADGQDGSVAPADLEQSIDAGEGDRVPRAGSAQARADKRWRVSPAKIMAVAAALLIVVGGFVWASGPQEDDTTELQVAGQEETTPDSDGDASVADVGETAETADESDSVQPEATNATSPDADAATTTQPPAPVDVGEISSEATLPLSMRPVAGSVASDVTLFSWTLPGSDRRQCENSGGVEALVALDSNGVQVAPLSYAGVSPLIVAGPDERIAIAESCEGTLESVQIGTFADTGAVRVDRWLIAPDGLFFSRFDPVWSFDGEQLLVHLQDRAGVLSLGTFDVQTGEVEVEPVTGRILAELGPDATVVATSRSVSLNGEPLLELDPDRGGASSVSAQVSTDGRHVAIFADEAIVVAGANGPTYRYDTSGDRIWAADWSTTGQLVFSTEGTSSLWMFDINSPGEFTPVPGMAGNWLSLEFADDGKTLTLFGEPAADPAGQVQTRILRLVPGPAIDGESAEPFGTLDQTVGEQPLALRGIGAIESGMTVAEAEAAVGGTLVEFAPLSGCSHAVLAGDANSPSFMVITYQEDGPDLEWSEGIISRIEIAGDAATLSGISVGSTKAEVLAAYGERIEVTPHHYSFAEGGEYLTFIPVSDEDGDFRLVMETLDDTVTTIRSGLLPAVEFVEGCA